MHQIATSPNETEMASCESLMEVSKLMFIDSFLVTFQSSYQLVNPFPSLLLCNSSTVVMAPTKLTKYDATMIPGSNRKGTVSPAL
jgi:hypothetical protein